MAEKTAENRGAEFQIKELGRPEFVARIDKHNVLHQLFANGWYIASAQGEVRVDTQALGSPYMVIIGNFNTVWHVDKVVYADYTDK